MDQRRKSSGYNSAPENFIFLSLLSFLGMKIDCSSCTLRPFYDAIGNAVNVGMLAEGGKRPVKIYINTREGLGWETKKVNGKNRVIGKFDKEYREDEYDMAYIIMHELGHGLGLSHKNQPESLMFYKPNSNTCMFYSNYPTDFKVVN